MSNNETGFIKIFILLLFLGLTSGLTACQENTSQIYNERESDAIIGGQIVNPNLSIAKRVIYLALGVKWTVATTAQSTQTSVEQSGTCTASAISPTVLLTAAHCVKNMTPSQINAVLSTNPWNHKLVLAEWIKVKKIIIHEGYSDKSATSGGGIQNDLALLQLEQALPDERVSKLASLENTSETLTLVSLGYGRTSPLENLTAEELAQEKLESLLRYVIKPVDNYNAAKPIFTINQNDFSGVCSGDSGGPGFIFDTQKKEFLVVGVTSYIAINDKEELALDPWQIYGQCIGRGNYSNVIYFNDWIQHAMSGL